MPLASRPDSPRKWRGPRSTVDTGTGEAFIANVRAAVAQIDENAAGAAIGRDPEYLHQLRVGLRRLRSTLRAFRRLPRRRKADEFDRALREILQSLGAARDWDVFCRSLRHSGLARAARRAGASARRDAREMLRSARFRATPRQVLAWANTAPWRSGADPDEPIRRLARRALRRLDKGLRKEARGFDWSDAARRHRIRIRVKRLRYACEAFAAAYQENEMRPFLKRLRKLQQILGDMNDIVVQRALLHGVARGPALRGPAAAARKVLAAREHGLTRQVSRSWSKFEAVKPFRRPAAAAPRPSLVVR